MDQYDERDIIFSRLQYRQGTEPYHEYYTRNPNKEEVDNIFRGKPVMGGKSATFYHPLYSLIPDACFEFLSDIKQYSEGKKSPECIESSPEVFTELIKGLTYYYNAKLVGITEMKDYHYYSHKGRPLAQYGEKIESNYRYGIVFAVEMIRDYIFTAPRLPESIAVTKGYIDAAIIGMVLSYYIRGLGYDARNNMDGNYIVIAPYVAEDAGLGELGHNGLLITKEYGPRVRLGVVTTNLPLIADENPGLGIREFCALCERCVRACPGKAIPQGDAFDEHGAWRWRIASDKCFAYWQKFGTDCGVCLAGCPFSNSLPPSLTKNLTSPQARQELLEYCNEHYGKRTYIKENPSWMQ